MLMLTLERMGVRRAAVYAAAARRAQQLSPLDGRRAFVALGQFQGALALIARMTRMRTLDVAAAEALVTSLSSVPLNQDGRYAGGVATWIQQELRPAIPRADDIENALFPALAGAPSADAPAGAPASTGKGSGTGSIRPRPKSSGCGAFARSSRAPRWIRR